jgi:2-haloacid dehalogenase
MIRDIFFDLDGTLFDFKKSEKIALSKTLDIFNTSYSDEMINRYSKINEEEWAKLEKGETTKAELQINRYARFFDEYNIPLSPEKVNAQFKELLHNGHHLIDGAQDVLNILKEKNYRLYIATNGTATIQISRLKKAGVYNLFDDIFISEELGFNKPDKRFFEESFKRIDDFNKESAIMVGDRLTSDIKGAVDANIKSIYYNPTGKKFDIDVTPTFEIADIFDIIKIVESL